MTIWQNICVRLFPLFNSELLTTSVESIIDLTEAYVRLTFERDASQALAVLHENLYKSAQTGLLSVTTRLQGHEGYSLLHALVVAWQFYYGTLLPYLEACLFPLESHAAQLAYMQQAARQRAPHDSQTPWIEEPAKGDTRPTPSMFQGVDVRRVLLLAFRDRVVLPIHDWLLSALDQRVGVDPPFLHRETGETDTLPKQLRPYLIQLMGILTGLHSDDAAQRRIEKLYNTLTCTPTVQIPPTESASSHSLFSPGASLSPGMTLSARSSTRTSPNPSES